MCLRARDDGVLEGTHHRITSSSKPLTTTRLAMLFWFFCPLSAGLDAYVATPAGPYKAAVLMIPDIYGWQTDGTRVWADNMAKQVCTLAAVRMLLSRNLSALQWS